VEVSANDRATARETVNALSWPLEVVMKSPLRLSLVIALVTVVSAIGHAQAAPDLSGVWTFDAERNPPPEPPPSPSAPGGPAPPPRLVALTIHQSPTELTVERTMAAARGKTIDQVTYRLDGTETQHKMGPFLEVTKASLTGARLTLSTVQTASDSFGPMAGKALAQVVETYRVEGDYLIVESVRTVNGTEGPRRRTTFKRTK
jgi:hypothetical protein